MIRTARRAALAILAASALTGAARADTSPCGPRLVRLLGDHAQHVFAPGASRLGALVSLPPGASAASLGLEPFASGFGRIHASAPDLLAYADLHPDLDIELAPPLHTLLDKAGLWIGSIEAHERLGLDGAGILVGVADTGLDVTLPDFRDPTTGKSRVAWLLDLSLPPAGIYPDLERQFCVQGVDGACQLGAAFQGSDLDRLIANPSSGAIPIDEYGHGTHVTSIAAGNGGPAKRYVGGAPGAQIVFARIVETRYDPAYSIVNDDLLTGVAFLFDRADAMKLPIAANLSIGTDFGPHDGSLAWERALAANVGESSPGHALAVAAGNSGSIALTPVHQVVSVVPGAGVVSVPIDAPASSTGNVEVWVTLTRGSTVSVGLDGPTGTWIAPVAAGQTGNDTTADYVASIVNGAGASCSAPVDGSCQIPGANIPAGSDGAVVVWDASGGAGWPGGAYAVTLEGEGTANLWISSDVTYPDGTAIAFAHGVREGTINLPATQPGLVAVGCTVNRTSWTDIDDAGWGLSFSPGLDPAGGLPEDAGTPFVNGEVCWFSSAGPNALGVPKPEISAPGSFVVGALSSEAPPGTAESIFTTTQCDSDAGIVTDCLEVDPQHAVAEGTSMSAPMVAGAIALLFQRDPTLTQTELVPILQGGAHYFRSGFDTFEDQGGPGELDVVASLALVEAMRDPTLVLPIAAASWITPSTDYALADGSTPTVAIVELRAAGGAAADLFEPSRLQAVATIGGMAVAPSPALVRRGPGVWTYTVTVPAGSGGRALSLGASFDGAPIVRARSIPVATDAWTAEYPSEAGGAGATCAMAREGPRTDLAPALGCLAALAVLLARRARGSAAREA